ncbi:MAG: quinoprotein glucose dehydrogenase, partial [Bacteroidia bacterium]
MKILICVLALLGATIAWGAEDAGWPVYGGDAGGSKFSALTDITPKNLHNLAVAWEFHTGDSSSLRDNVPPTSFLATPVLHDNTLFFCSGLSRLFAVDAETGEQRWVYDSKPDLTGTGTAKCRGVALWHEQRADAGSVCKLRIFMGTLDGRLVAVDGATGKPCEDFGADGVIDLKADLGDVQDSEMAMTSPPQIVGDVVIQGAMVRDNERADPPGGVIRGWDARTGALRWAFDPVPPDAPSPQQIGAPADQLYHRGTPNAWSILSADLQRKLVFIPFGSPGLDFIGGHRKRHGFDYGYYANSIVALDALSGEVVWHFQTVHHD